MNYRFVTGVVLAMLAGTSTYLGQVFQKVAVNSIPEKFAEKKYHYLLKNKIWLLGLALYIVLATVFYMLSELLIGPIMVPGLTTFGLIALVIASVKIANEKITGKVIAGMILLSAGTVTIASSKLVIDYKQVSLNNIALIERILYFTGTTILLWLLFNYFVQKSNTKKGIFKAIAAGFPYVLSNFWILPLYVSMPYIFKGQPDLIIILFFIASSIILIVVNILGITELQIAYGLENVNLVAPVQQIPIQIAPVAYYYILYRSFGGKSVFILMTGIALIIISGFLLASQHNSNKAKNFSDPVR